MFPRSRLSVPIWGLLFVAMPMPVSASFVDWDSNRPGIQSVGWAQPTTIMIFVPSTLTGADRMNFEMGINSVAECLTKIQVQFKDGDPPANAQDFIDVNIMNLGAPPFGRSGPLVPSPYPSNTDHVITHSGQLNIDPGALGHSANAGSFMKNLGAHEFGHVLGLEDDPRTSGDRTNLMDPDFNLLVDDQGQVVGADPFVPLSDRDKMMLRAHYCVVPEPGTHVQIAFGAMCVLGCLWRYERRTKTHQSCWS